MWCFLRAAKKTVREFLRHRKGLTQQLQIRPKVPFTQHLGLDKIHAACFMYRTSLGIPPRVCSSLESHLCSQSSVSLYGQLPGFC